jgi:hypothetical protein
LALRRALILVFLVAARLCGAAEDPAAAVQERIKAAYLYKFPGYVEWPAESFAEAAAPIVICVAGAHGLADELEQAIAGKRVGERGLRVRRLLRNDDACDGGHMLYVGRDLERARATELLEQARGKPLLTVTNSDSPQPRGSVIHFVLVADRVRFDVSREAAEQNRLRLASPLLSVARHVRGKP